MKNTKKNAGGVTGKGFDIVGQPSPEAKKKGWERRREAQRIMDMMLELQNKSMAEIQFMIADVKENPEKYTLLQIKLASYLHSNKYTPDFLDRHIPKAPTTLELKPDQKTYDTIKRLANTVQKLIQDDEGLNKTSDKRDNSNTVQE